MAAEVKHLGCTKPALLYDNGALGLSTKADIANDMKFAISVQTSETATDLTPALQQIRKAGATCIVEASDALGAVGSMIATMANTGYKVPVLGDSGVTLASFVATAGAAPLKAVPVYGSDVFNPDTSYFKTLFAGYASKYGAAPPVEEIASTWDSVQLLAAALKADGGKGGATLASALQNTSGKGIASLIGYQSATPSFSATSHDWVPTSADKMFRVTAGAGQHHRAHAHRNRRLRGANASLSSSASRHMGTIISILVDALAFGGVYALLAMGFSVILRSSRVAQFGAGYVALVGGLVMAQLTPGLPGWLSLIIALPVGAVLGVVLFFAIAKVGAFFGASETSLSIAALAFGLLIGSIIDKATSAAVQTAPLFVKGYVTISGAAIEWNSFFTIGASFVILIAAYFLVGRTMLGKAMTAVCRAPSVAAASGLRIDWIICASWMIGTALMTYAGAVLTPMSPISSDSVLALALKGFAGAIIGGVDRPAHAAAGALLLALADTLFVRYVSGGLEDLFVFGLVFVLLALRPGGLFGSRQVRYA